MKIRGSFSITANQEIGDYQSLAKLVSGNYTDGTSIINGFYETIGNDDLKWEKTSQWDIGFDAMLFNRVTINFDYYTRNTNDLLYNVPIPSTSGFQSVLSNVGKVMNRGWELTIGGSIVRTKDLNIDASVNLTYNKNEIKELYGDVDEVAIKYSPAGIAQILKVGNPVDGVYSRKSLGIIKTEEQLAWYKETVPNTAASARLGDEMYADLDGDGSIGSADYICLGSVQPKYYYGLNLSADYKGLGLSIFGQGGTKYASILGAENAAALNSSWSMGYADLSGFMLYGENQVLNNIYIPTEYAYKRMWSPSNPGGSFPAAGAHNVYLSDRTNANWKYFILKNIQLSYDFSNIIKMKAFKKLVLNVNFQNFVTFSNQRGYNPINGDASNPWAKSVIIGVNAKF